MRQQKQQLYDDTKSLEQSIHQQNVLLTELTQAVLDQKRQKSDVDSELHDVQEALSTARQELTSIESKKARESNLLAEIKDARKALHTDKLQLERDVSVLTSGKVAEEAAVQQLQTTKTNLEKRISDLDTQYDAKLAEKEAQIALLDVTLLKSRQELEKHQSEDAVVRDSLASWQKRLEERDKNLRIREYTVEQGEGKLINNSNLLNL